MKRQQVIVFVMTVVIGGLYAWARWTDPPKEGKVIDIDKAAAETTQAAGKNLTRGAIQALKEEFSK